jgi:hypothetical protein
MNAPNKKAALGGFVISTALVVVLYVYVLDTHVQTLAHSIIDWLGRL